MGRGARLEWRKERLEVESRLSCAGWLGPWATEQGEMQEGGFNSLQARACYCLNSNRAQGLPSRRGDLGVPQKPQQKAQRCLVLRLWGMVSSGTLTPVSFPAAVAQGRGCQPDWVLPGPHSG